MRAQYRIERSELFPQIDGDRRRDDQLLGAAAAEPRRVPRRRERVVRARSVRPRAQPQGRRARGSTSRAEEAHRAAHLALVGEVVDAVPARARLRRAARSSPSRRVATVRESYELTSACSRPGSAVRARRAHRGGAGRTAREPRSRGSRACARQAENALVLLVGQPLPANLPAPQPLDAQRVDRRSRRRACRRRCCCAGPTSLAAEHVLRAANANIGAARAAFFPTISLTGFAGLASTALSSLFTGGACAWTFAPQLSRAAVHRRPQHREPRRREGPQAHRGRALRAGDPGRVPRGRRRARRARATFDEQLAAQTARVEAEQRRFEISETRYRSGIESYLVVLDRAARSLRGAAAARSRCGSRGSQNLADLYRALGGGWRER